MMHMECVQHCCYNKAMCVALRFALRVASSVDRALQSLVTIFHPPPTPPPKNARQDQKNQIPNHLQE